MRIIVSLLMLGVLSFGPVIARAEEVAVFKNKEGKVIFTIAEDYVIWNKVKINYATLKKLLDGAKGFGIRDWEVK